ncbi:uncharacterized protein VICG_00254 [Vittaforma corneae ATCC 50505]|uniref:Uncharacterized protein n=1 Tax=Vittaforma corneae (strain ATCC 50505) TaxID=993615 RepID=L2GQN8_VITCO|nr:uncharacterized protein VICG_00254 [Vittaforma corneae ATCC 50505]ELA42939.1 hypothetical protein VICG_00254 [Vittaforma corneae ATCC 50505]
MSEHAFEFEFGRVVKILSLRNFIIIFYENGHYNLGTIRNLEIELDEAPNDGQFFNVLGSEMFDDKIVILAKTFTQSYLLTYSLENCKFKVVKKDIQGGNAIARHSSSMLLIFNKEGLWKYQDKLVFIKEFANFKIACSYFDEENNRTLLFCSNGEVISINSDFSHLTVGFTKSKIASVAKIGTTFFCGSIQLSYFLRIADHLIILKVLGNVLSGKAGRSLNDHCSSLRSRLLLKLLYQRELSSDPVSLDHGSSGDWPIKKIQESANIAIDDVAKRLLEICELRDEAPCFMGYYRGDRFFIFSFEQFSVINNCCFEPVVNASSSCIFTSKRILCFSQECIFQFNLECSRVKIYQDLALVYSFGSLYLFNTSSQSFKSCSVSFDLCDFILRDEKVLCIDFDEKTHIIEEAGFNILYIEKHALSFDDLFGEHCQMLSLSNSQTFNSKYLCDFCTDLPKPFLVANGKIFTLIDGIKPYVLLSSGSYIHNITHCKNYLIVSGSNTIVFDTTGAMTSYCNFKSTNSFMVDDSIYACLPSGQIQQIVPETLCFAENLFNEKYACHTCKTSTEISIDRKSIKYSLGTSTLEYANYVQKFSCAVRKNLFCVGLISINFDRNKLVFFSTDNKKLKIRHTIELSSMPICGCAYKNNVCVVTSDSIMLISLKYGKIKISEKIKNTHYPCKGLEFYNESTVLVTTLDWFYLVVNLKMNLVKKIQTENFCIPFMINGIDGHATRNMLHYHGAVIDCIEDVAYIVSHKNSILILTTNGSVLFLHTIQSDTFRFIYDSAPKVINNLVEH